jgi:outer membrane protein assembly factor BamB
MSAFSTPVTNGLLLAWRWYNGVYAVVGLDAHTGKVAWQEPFACRAVASNPESPKTLYPSCQVEWESVIGGKLYLLLSDNKSQNDGQNAQIIYTLKSIDPRTGQLLSEHPLRSSQDRPSAIGADNGLLYATIGVPRTANTIPYDDTIFVAYRLSDGTEVWRHAMPPFPPPLGANTSPNTSGAVLAP